MEATQYQIKVERLSEPYILMKYAFQISLYVFITLNSISPWWKSSFVNSTCIFELGICGEMVLNGLIPLYAVPDDPAAQSYAL